MNNSFQNMKLSKEILKAIDNLGFNEPSEVQKVAIPELLSKNDIIVKSQTGSGKTASFGIPLCELINSEESKVQGLILVPTRELAMQVKEDISNIGVLKKIRVAAIFGKQPFNDQVRELKQRVHIVVGTPGRVKDHIERGSLKVENIEFVVVDEGDKMLNMGFVDQIEDIFKDLPKGKNMTLFSATLPDTIQVLCSKYMNNPKVLDVKSKIFNREKIKESYLDLEEKDKFSELCRDLYAYNPKAAIVFCNTREKVRKIFTLLKREGVRAEELHGDMEQKDRLTTMERFKNKEFKVLVATDVAARGIHIEDITHVFNYEVPMEKESYVHRIGRTGRVGKEGYAITFVSSNEKKTLASIEEYIGYEIGKGLYVSDEAVREGRALFRESQKELSKNFQKKNDSIHKDLTKIHISGGKKKKIRALDILGAFSNIKGLKSDDIGVIDIQDGCSFVDILNGKGNNLLRNYNEVNIKGKKVRLSKAKR